MKINGILTKLYKGSIIGLGVIIPGLSGGTVASILNVYEDILEAIANIRLHFKKSIIYLTTLGLGALTSLYLLSSPFEAYCSEYPKLSKYSFCAITVVGIVLFVKENINLHINKNKIISFSFGFCISYFLNCLINADKIASTISNPIIVFIIGFPISLALILPGISFSYMLLYFGIYDRTLNAVNQFDLTFFIPLLFGIILGTYIFSRLLFSLINKRKQETYSFVLGFVVNSLLEILFSI